MARVTKGEPIIYAETGLSMPMGLPCWLMAQKGLAPLASERPDLIIHISGVVSPATGEVWLWQQWVLTVELYVGLCKSLVAMWFVYCYELVTGVLI